MKAAEPEFLRLVYEKEIDEDTAYTMCHLINFVGNDIEGFDWDWDWYTETRGEFRNLLKRSLVVKAWKQLEHLDLISLQATDDEMPRIVSLAPLGGMMNLTSLGIQDNRVVDLRPIAKMSKLKFLNVGSNQIVDLSPLADLKELEVIHLGENPVDSFAALERLPKLRKLVISTDQLASFAGCKQLASLRILRIEEEGVVDDLKRLPELPSLRVLSIRGVKKTCGIERFVSLNTLEIAQGQYSRLDGVEQLNHLTHLKAASAQPMSIQMLENLVTLRSVKIVAPFVSGLSALRRLPLLHELQIRGQRDANIKCCDEAELVAVRNSLAPWSDEFLATEIKTDPTFYIEVINSGTLDDYENGLFGIVPDEYECGMIESEREWVQEVLIRSIEAIGLTHGENRDFSIGDHNSCIRSIGLFLFNIRAYKSLREMLIAVQRILGSVRSDWIVHCYVMSSEGADWEQLPEEAEDLSALFTLNKVITNRKGAPVLRSLLN